jgi:hypothetical protein
MAGVFPEGQRAGRVLLVRQVTVQVGGWDRSHCSAFSAPTIFTMDLGRQLSI